MVDDLIAQAEKYRSKDNGCYPERICADRNLQKSIAKNRQLLGMRKRNPASQAKLWGRPHKNPELICAAQAANSMLISADCMSVEGSFGAWKA